MLIDYFALIWYHFNIFINRRIKMKFKRILAGICALTIIAALSACTTETTDSESSEV